MTRMLTRPRKANQNAFREIQLREDFTPSGKSARVDKAAGIIYRVKVLGKTSKNAHDTPGVTGTDYTDEALHQARPLYEGIHVNVDHPPRDGKFADRSARDRIGWLKNVSVDADGIYADLHVLLSDPLSAKLLESAERNPELFGLSHNAYGKSRVQDGRLVIYEIKSVRSVDLVADAGSTTSLFESKETPMKKTIRQLLEAAGCDKEDVKKVAEQDGMDAMDEPPVADDGDWKADIIAAIGKLTSSDDESNHAMAKKILTMLKPQAKGVDVEEGSDELRGKNQDAQMRAIQAKDPEGKGGGHNESLDELRAEMMLLRRDKNVRLLCESLAFEPSKEQFALLLDLPTDAGRKALVKQLKPTKAKPANTPRSNGAHSFLESYEGDMPKDSKDFAKQLCRA